MFTVLKCQLTSEMLITKKATSTRRVFGPVASSLQSRVVWEAVLHVRKSSGMTLVMLESLTRKAPGDAFLKTNIRRRLVSGC